MLSFHFLLDTRRIPAGSPAPLKFIISKRQRNGMLATGLQLLPEQWDAVAQKVIKHPRAKAYNGLLSRLMMQAEDFLMPQLYAGKLASLSAVEIKDLFAEQLGGAHKAEKTLGQIYTAHQSALTTANTRGGCRSAWKRIVAAIPDAASLPVSRITPAWAKALDERLTAAGYGPNTRRATFSHLRAAWSRAELPSDVFRKVQIRQPLTAKRDLTLDQMRKLWRAVPVNDAEAEALAFFKCSFLMLAANPCDILKMRPAQVINGRIYYTRSKTGKEYSVKVEPELAKLLAGRSSASRLWPVRIPSYPQQVNKALKTMATREGLPSALSLYYARHSLASLLYNRGESMDIVSAALGHSLGGARVTATYVNADLVAVDKAFRELLDAILQD